jgi:hypothetical protein
MLGDFNAKVGREDIFKPEIWNEGLQEIINDNAIRLVHFATSQNLGVESNMFPHRNKEELPDQLKESIIVPVHKKSDKTDCNNYHGMTAINIIQNFIEYPHHKVKSVRR